MRLLRCLTASIALTAAALPATPGALAAQLAVPSGLRALPLQSAPSAGLITDTASARSQLPARLGLGLLGGLAGLFGGAILAASLELGPDCDCDEPEIGWAVTGAVVGVALGAALGAAIPRGTADCRYVARLWRGVATAGIGVAAGFVGPRDARIVTVPLGGIVGAALGAESCAWRRHG